MLAKLRVRRAWQAQLKDVLRELNCAQKLRVVVDSGKDTLRVLARILEETWNENVLATREVLANTLDHDGHLKDLIGVRSLSSLHLQ